MLLGGCSTPISALAEVEDGQVIFHGNILSLDGSNKIEIEKLVPLSNAASLGREAAHELLRNGGQEIADSIRNS